MLHLYIGGSDADVEQTQAGIFPHKLKGKKEIHAVKDSQFYQGKLQVLLALFATQVKDTTQFLFLSFNYCSNGFPLSCFQ